MADEPMREGCEGCEGECVRESVRGNVREDI